MASFIQALLYKSTLHMRTICLKWLKYASLFTTQIKQNQEPNWTWQLALASNVCLFQSARYSQIICASIFKYGFKFIVQITYVNLQLKR